MYVAEINTDKGRVGDVVMRVREMVNENQKRRCYKGESRLASRVNMKKGTHNFIYKSGKSER
jgi:hypothetical protein